MSGKSARALAVAALGAALLLDPVAPAAAAPPGPVPLPPPAGGLGPDIRHPDPEALAFRDERGRPVTAEQFADRLATSERSAAAAEGPAQVGDSRLWPALDETVGFYLKTFVLRAVGERIEVWTAEGEQGPEGQPASTDLDYLPGDCRNGPRTALTDEQVAGLVAEFDGTIHPVSSAAFSTPPSRDGSGELTGGELDTSGDGEKIVTLVDNVRDANFYDVDNTQSLPYIAGFFASVLTEFTDRNVITIDGFDWLHRTGAFPPDDASADPCTNAPARPFQYEGVVAHEYQHLLEYYEDPDEAAWVNEGLSDYAATLTGYTDPSRSVFQPGHDSHVQCFLGFLTVRTPYNTIPREQCGPSNSLTLWGDQGGDNILADYGAAASMMEYLLTRFGPDFLSQLHREDGNGLQGLRDVLAAYAPTTDAQEVLHDWAATVALDAPLDRGGRFVGEGLASRLRADTLHAEVLWSNPEAHTSGEGALGVGAPPNGSDYVGVVGADGLPLSARDVGRIEFEGAATLPGAPVEWVVDEAPEGRDGAAFHSGAGDDLDRTIAREVTVPADDPTLTIATRWDTEPGFDSGFVQVSADGGATWTSLGNADTTDELDPTAIPLLVENLPGLNGQGGWKDSTFSLAEHAGQTVLLGFRYVTDPAVVAPGWWVDDVRVGGTLLADGTSLEGWRSYSEIAPEPVAGWTVQVVAYGDTPLHAPVTLVRLPVGADLSGALDGRALLRGVRGDLEHVAVIVTLDDPAETATAYAPYRLLVDGVEQPGGGWTEPDAAAEPPDPRV